MGAGFLLRPPPTGGNAFQTAKGPPPAFRESPRGAKKDTSPVYYARPGFAPVLAPDSTIRGDLGMIFGTKVDAPTDTWSGNASRRCKTGQRPPLFFILRLWETAMVSLINALTGNIDDGADDVMFPYRPEGWTVDVYRKQAVAEGLEFQEDHLVLIWSLQEFFRRNKDTGINMLRLHDALEEKFHYKGGLKYLYRICPGGPVAQGCRLAGLKVPAGAMDLSYGSVA